MADNKKFIDYFFVVGLFFFGLWYYCFRILGFDLGTTPGDYGDSRFINYVLEHGFRWLKGEDPDFWRAGFMYPLKNNIAISDSMAGALPVYALFRFMRFDMETAYQLWWLSTCILNFWCCFFAFKKIGFNHFLCAIGAYVFAFGINNFNQFQHLQFNYKFLIPVAIAALYLFLKLPRVKYFVVLMACIVFQFYASAYLGIMLFYFSLAFACSYLLYAENWQRFKSGITKRSGIYMGLIIVISACLLLVIALPYRSMANMVGYRDYYVEILDVLPRIYSYFFSSPASVTWAVLQDSPLKEGPAWYLHDLFPGAFCYLGIFIAPFYFIRKAIRKEKIDYLPVVILITAVLFMLVCSKTESGFSLFRFFRKLPGLESMRLTSRFMIIAVFFLTWLSLYFINRIPQKKVLVIYVLFAVFVIVDNLFTPNAMLLSMTPKKTREDRVESMCARIIEKNTEHKKIIACINTAGDMEAFMQLDVMLACQKLNLKTLNGYSSTCYGNLCVAYSDPAHVKLSEWMKEHFIDEKDVLFITN